MRPQCSRCQERGEDCVYEAIRPRQRRKREHLSIDTTSQSGLTLDQWQRQQQEWTDDAQTDDGLSSAMGPLSSASEMDMFPWTPADTTFSPMTPANFDLSSIDGRSTVPDEEDVEEIVRCNSFTSNPGAHAALVQRNQEPSPYLEFNIPFSDFTQRKNRRHLVDHFCNVLSHLIVFREENGNPFQQLVLPLSHSSPAVMDSIYALASAHLEFRGVENMEKSDYFHGRAIKELARLIENGGGEDQNELLAAIMLLVYYEVLVQKGRSNIVDGHLKGAMSIMSNREASTDPTGVFLERVCIDES